MNKFFIMENREYNDSLLGLYDIIEPNISNSLEFNTIQPGMSCFRVINKDSMNILNNTAMWNHNTLPDESFHQAIEKSLSWLSVEFLTEFALVNHYVRTIWPIFKIEGTQESQVTSSIYPKMTNTIFLSIFALRHIPPKSISDIEYLEILAENIYHEAIHLAVNDLILHGKILIPEYDKATAKKITIPWRSDSPLSRNKYWEIDRVLHACSVYCYLRKFRGKLMKIDSLDSTLYNFLAGTLNIAESNFSFLKSSLLDNLESFTPKGVEYIKSLS